MEFGHVSSQAFLEMSCEDAASNMVAYYSTVVPVIRHQPVYVQFSNHKELRTDNSPNQEVERVRGSGLLWPGCSWCALVLRGSRQLSRPLGPLLWIGVWWAQARC